MNLGWFLPLAVFTSIALALLLFFGMRDYKSVNNRKYSMLTMFPFEMISSGTTPSKSTRILLFAFAGLEGLVGAFFVLTINYHVSLLAIGIVFLIVEILKVIALLAVFLVPAYSFKPHLFSFTAMVSLSVLSSAIALVLFLNLRVYDETMSMAFAVIAGLLGAGQLALLLNPRLAHWTELKSTMEKDGSIVVERPKPFPLAFTEWLIFFLSFASSLIALIGFALINGFQA